MKEEKIVKINGIEVSKSTGFKNLQFETSRYSDGLNTIRGFGSILNEQNLNTIDTVSMDFILNYYELNNLAYIYNLFKANGVLPIESEYLLKKIKSTYTKGKTKEEINKNKNDLYLKDDISHFLCLLQRLSITSLEKTDNAYKVNMILTLYESAFTSDEYEKYMKCYDEWNKKTNFEKICNSEINKIIEELSTKSDININIYNVEKLNALYKEHIINNSAFNSKLRSENKYENEEKGNYRLDRIRSMVQNIDLSQAGKNISIPNHSILQIEMITNNNISHVPILGKPIGYKSFLGIGDTHFSVKLIFNEWENEIVEQLKIISDKNIINHKIELKHPLIQLFDFHTSNILNITFNNLEEANGIMVNIIFSLNGFRFSEETTINLDDLVYKVEYDNDFKQEEIAGLYLEYLSNYMFNNRKKPSIAPRLLSNTILESMIIGNETQSKNPENNKFVIDYHFLDFLASYSSLPTSFGAHSYVDNIACDQPTLFDKIPEREYLNDFFNKNIDIFEDFDQNIAIGSKDMFLLNNFSLPISDDKLNSYRSLLNGKDYYSYVDNISALTIMANTKYKNKIINYLYSVNFVNFGFEFIMNEVLKPLSIELFNAKQNGDYSIYKNEIYKKIYDEFFYRLFYNLNINLSDLINEIKNISYLNSDSSINFKNIFKSLSLLSDNFYSLFIKTLHDGSFHERLTYEVIKENLDNQQQNEAREQIRNNINEVKENIKQFSLEFENKYNINKKFINERAYNIFLTKLNYFLFNYCNSNNISNNKTHLSSAIEYENKFSFDIENLIKIYLISSSIHSLLLNRTNTRTDHFENQIVSGMKNIGYKISTYNSRLHQKIIKDKDGNEVKKDVMFYELFYEKDREYSEENFYYQDKVKFSDFLYEYKTMFDGNPNKDINFFYGQKISQLMLYKDLYNISKVEIEKNEHKDVIDFLNKEKKIFVYNDYPKDENNINKYNYNGININEIKFPLLNFGFTPSHFTELFYDKDTNLMNETMKKRVIGNIDPFDNMQKIAKIVYDETNYIMPDYDICIYKKEYNYNTGDRYKLINERQYIFLKNAGSISIVKNPKNKIKTMTITLNNTSKSIFNFNPINGSFDMLSLMNGDIKIVHVEVGDEIRLRIGYDEKTQIFNGFVNNITNAGNQLILNCSSFASLLYNEKMAELDLRPGSSGFLNKIGGFFKTISNKMKTTLEELDDGYQNTIRSLHNVFNPINDHIFVSHDKKEFYNEVFKDGERATMYSAVNLSLANLKTFCAEKFVKSKLSDITQNKLVSEMFIKRSLKNFSGAPNISEQTNNKTYNIFTNINNVDVDYETYGIRKKEIRNINIAQHMKETFFSSEKYTCPYSVNYYKYYGEVPGYYKSDEITPKPSEKEQHKIDNNEDIYIDENNNLNGSYGDIGLPVKPTTNIITSLYKEKRPYGYHKGIDIVSPTPNSLESKYILSIADGIVVTVGNGPTAGVRVEICHKFKTVDGKEKKFISGYMHLEYADVKVGDKVLKGQRIGIMGNTGRSTGTHLHFEIYTLENHLGKPQYMNPFDAQFLPRHNWNISWDNVNINADNGQYTDEWKEKYSKAKKVLASRK